MVAWRGAVRDSDPGDAVWPGTCGVRPGGGRRAAGLGKKEDGGTQPPAGDV